MKFRLNLVFISLCSLVAGCTANQTQQQNPVVQLSQSSAYEQMITYLQNQMKQKSPYGEAPIKIQIQPGLLTNQAGPTLDLSDVLNIQDNFKVQSVKDAVVFQETFVGHSDYVEANRTFNVDDTNLRYTLKITLSGVSLPNNGAASLILNGRQIEIPLIHSMPFELHSVILKDNNTLSLQTTNLPGETLEISLVATEAAGTVLRKRQAQSSPGQVEELVQARWQQFLPHSNGLEPDLHVLGVASISADGEHPISFESNTLLLRLNQPELVLPELTRLYGAKVRHVFEIPGHPEFSTYYIQFEPENSPLADTTALIRAYRDRIALSFSSFSFTSLDALKTFVILLDLLERHPDWVKHWDFNYFTPQNYAQNPTTTKDVPTITTNDWDTAGPSPPIGVNMGWWLRDTFVREAWNFSIGTGVKAGYIDWGFVNAQKSGANHPELGNRLILNSYGIQNGLVLPTLPGDSSKLGSYPQDPNNSLECINPSPLPGSTSSTQPCQETHGIDTIKVGFAERDNSFGTVGTAPNAHVIPCNKGGFLSGAIHCLTGMMFRSNFEEHRPDVIGFNANWFDPVGWKPVLTGTPADLGSVQFLLLDLLNAVSGIPMVFPAGNEGLLLPHAGQLNSPAMYSGLPSYLDPSKRLRLIIAGGMERDGSKPVPSNNPGYRYDPNPNGELRGRHRSNVGDKFIWAPASEVSVFREKSNNVIPSYGTSFACPFLTGVVALMKSRNPDLTPEQIYSILSSSPTRINITHGGLPFALNNQPVVDVQDAVEKAIAALPPKPGVTSLLANHLAKPYVGYIKHYSGGAQISLVMNQSVNPNMQVPHKREVNLMKSVSQPVWNKLTDGQPVMLKGWLNEDQELFRQGKGRLAFGQLEVLEIKPLNSGPQITDAEIIQNGVSTTSFSKTQAFQVKIKGTELLAPLKLTSGNQSLQLVFKEAGGPEIGGVKMDFQQPEEILNNEGTQAVFALDPAKDHVLLNKLIVGKSYTVSVVGAQGGSGFKGHRTGNFKVSNTAPSATMGIKFEGPSLEDMPKDRYEYDRVGNRWLISGQQLEVDAHQFVGIYFTQPIRNLEVKIGPVLVPIVDILEDLAVIGIPEDLPAGVHDVIIKASNQTLTLEQAVTKVSQAVSPAPEPSPPPSGDPDQHRYARIFNLEGADEGRVYLNDELILTASAGEDKSVYFDEYGSHPLRTDKRNEVRFELTNNGGGYTYGFEIYGRDNSTVYKDVKGTPYVKNVALYGDEEDRTQGLVYKEKIMLNNRLTPVGSGPFWFKVFNLNNDEALTVRANNETDDRTWQNETFRVTGPMGQVSRSIPIASFDNYCGSNNPGYECWKSNWIYFSLENGSGPYNVGIELYKGINLIYRNIQGQSGSWGADGNTYEEPSNISEYLIREYRHFQRTPF